MQVDKNRFTKTQWEAITVYVEARKRKRRFTMKAGVAAILGCSAALMSPSILQDGMFNVPASLEWVQVALPIVLLIVLQSEPPPFIGQSPSRAGLVRAACERTYC